MASKFAVLKWIRVKGGYRAVDLFKCLNLGKGHRGKDRKTMACLHNAAGKKNIAMMESLSKEYNGLYMGFR